MSKLSSDDLDDLAMQCEDGPEVTVGAPTLLSLIAAARELKERRWIPGGEPPQSASIGECFLCYLETSLNSVPIVLEYVGAGQFVDPEGQVETMVPSHWMPLPKGPTNGR